MKTTFEDNLVAHIVNSIMSVALVDECYCIVVDGNEGRTEIWLDSNDIWTTYAHNFRRELAEKAALGLPKNKKAVEKVREAVVGHLCKWKQNQRVTGVA